MWTLLAPTGCMQQLVLLREAYVRLGSAQPVTTSSAQLVAVPQVLGLEKFGLAHELGSSHGFTRIIRHTYFEGPQYVPLLARARELWKELEVTSGTKLMHETGGLNIGFDVATGALETARMHGLPHTKMTGAEVNAKFPGYNLPDDFAVRTPECACSGSGRLSQPAAVRPVCDLRSLLRYCGRALVDGAPSHKLLNQVTVSPHGAGTGQRAPA